MILRISESLSRGLVVLAAIVIAATLCSYSVRMAIAAHAAERETVSGLETAIHLEPSNPDYWYRIGHFQQFNLEEPDPSLAALYLRKAIALNPLYTDAWLDLGTNYELEGNAKAAREAFLQAKISYPSSAEVAWRYGNFLLREGELPAAYAEIQLAVRLDPHRAATAFSRCYRADPDIDAILNQALPAEPVGVRRGARRSRSLQATCRCADGVGALATHASALAFSGLRSFCFGAFGCGTSERSTPRMGRRCCHDDSPCSRADQGFCGLGSQF